MTQDPERSHEEPSAANADLIDWALLRGWVHLAIGAPRRHRVLALACLVAVVGAAGASLKVLPKRFQVKAAVLAQPNPLRLDVNPYDAPTRAAREVVLRRENLVALLKTTNFVERYVQMRSPAARARDWLFARLGRTRTHQQLVDDLADSLEDRLWVNASPAAGTIEFGFEWSNPELTYDVVEGAIQSFLEARHTSEIGSLGETIAILEDHASRFNAEIVERTKQVEALEQEARRKTPRGTVSRPRVALSASALEIEERLSAKRRTLAELEEYRRRRVAELQSQLLQQESMYAEQHPIVVATRRSLDALASPSPQLESLRSEVSGLEREAMRRGLGPPPPRETLPSMVTDLGLSSLHDDPTLEYERNELYMLIRQRSALLEQIDRARLELDTARAGFKYRYTVVTPPQIPKGPIKPSPLKLMLMALAGGLALAVFASVAADLRSGRILERCQVEQGLDVPVLAVLRERP